MSTAIGLTVLACLAACVALLVSEFRQWPVGRAAAKIAASSAFLAVAIQCDAAASTYGQLILAALALSWVGDVLLLSQRSRFFLPGIGSFLLAHGVFSIAFLFQPIHGIALGVGLVVMGVIGTRVLTWLWPHLSGFYRVAVGAYVAAIVVMCALAIAVSAATGSWLLAAGAVAFALSDISVARDRFVAHAFINRLWGLPLYYGAQLVLALSVAAAVA